MMFWARLTEENGIKSKFVYLAVMRPAWRIFDKSGILEFERFVTGKGFRVQKIDVRFLGGNKLPEFSVDEVVPNEYSTTRCLFVYLNIQTPLRCIPIDKSMENLANKLNNFLIENQLAFLWNCFIILNFNEVDGCALWRNEIVRKMDKASEKFFGYAETICFDMDRDAVKPGINKTAKKLDCQEIDKCFCVTEATELTITDSDRFWDEILGYSYLSTKSCPFLQVMKTYIGSPYHKLVTTNRSIWADAALEITHIKFSKHMKNKFKVSKFTSIDEKLEGYPKGVFVIEIVGYSLFRSDPEKVANQIIEFLTKKVETFNHSLKGYCVVLCVDQNDVKEGGKIHLKQITDEITRILYRKIISEIDSNIN